MKAKGDYVLALKGSQGECFNDVQLFLNSQLEKKFENAHHSYFESIDRNHGRIEKRQVWVSTDVAWLHECHPDGTPLNPSLLFTVFESKQSTSQKKSVTSYQAIVAKMPNLSPCYPH